MKYHLKITEEAAEDIIAAYLWYEQKSEGLGEQFLSILDEIYSEILKTPYGFQKKFKKLREAPVPIFPFVIVFQIFEEEVVIFSVFHTSRDPKNKL